MNQDRQRSNDLVAGAGDERGDFFERLALGQVEADLPDADLGVFAAVFNLVRAANRVVNDLESSVHRPAGWSWAGFRMMFTIWVSGPLEPREIAHRAAISRAAVSSVLNTLERDGLVERARDQADRRLVTVRLTPLGRRRLRRAVARQNAREQDLLGELDQRQLVELNRMLRTVGTTRSAGQVPL